MFVGTVHRCHLVCLSDMSVYQYVGMSVCQYVSDGMSVCQYAGMSITQRVPELLKAGAAGTCRSRFITINLNHCDQIRRTSKNQHLRRSACPGASIATSQKIYICFNRTIHRLICRQCGWPAVSHSG